MSEALPAIAARINQCVESLRRQVPAAKVVGKFAVDYAWRQAQNQFARLTKESPIVEEATGDSKDGGSAPHIATDLPDSFVDYEVLNARQVLDRLPTISRDDALAVLRWEESHRNRSTLIAGLNRLLKKLDQSV